MSEPTDLFLTNDDTLACLGAFLANYCQQKNDFGFTLSTLAGFGLILQGVTLNQLNPEQLTQKMDEAYALYKKTLDFTNADDIAKGFAE